MTLRSQVASAFASSVRPRSSLIGRPACAMPSPLQRVRTMGNAPVVRDRPPAAWAFIDRPRRTFSLPVSLVSSWFTELRWPSCPARTFPAPSRRTWAAAFTAVLVLALNQGRPAADVIELATGVLVLIALVVGVGSNNE